MIHYIQVSKQLIKLFLMHFMEYRLNGVLSFAETILNLFLSLVFFQIVFQKTNAIGGWTRGEIFLFYGVFLLITNIFNMFFEANIGKLQDYVEDGTFDMMLVKPINILFLLSFRIINIFKIIDITFSLFIIYYAAILLSLQINIGLFFSFVIYLVFGLMIYYSIYVMITTISFWTVRTPFFEFFDNLTSVTRYPLDIFGDRWVILFTYLIPLIFVVTVPTQILLGKLGTLHYISPIIAVILFLLMLKFWNFAVKNYSSASS